MDPFALPCHPSLRIDAADRDWRAVGVRTTDGVRRKSTRCPACKSSWTAFERVLGEDTTVEWLQSVPFRVTAVPAGGVKWQDLSVGEAAEPLDGPVAVPDLPDWAGSVQGVAVVAPLTAGGELFAQPGDVLLERRLKWNAQDRRLALLWSPRVGGPVVAWHSFARLPQD